MRFVVGLTGKVGTGKSTVAAIMKSLGAQVLDVDKIGHQCLEDDEVKNKIRAAFGSGVFVKNAVDRGKLAEIVFSSEKQLKKLENIVHPVMIETVKNHLNHLSGVVVLEAAVLHRMGMDKLCDVIITVTASEKSIYERLKKKGISDLDIQRRLSMQKDVLPGDIVFVNEGNLSEIQTKVKTLWDKVLKLLWNHEKMGEVLL